MNKIKTQIQIDKTLRKELIGLRIVPMETHNNVIIRLIKTYKEVNNK